MKTRTLIERALLATLIIPAHMNVLRAAPVALAPPTIEQLNIFGKNVQETLGQDGAQNAGSVYMIMTKYDKIKVADQKLIIADASYFSQGLYSKLGVSPTAEVENAIAQVSHCQDCDYRLHSVGGKLLNNPSAASLNLPRDFSSRYPKNGHQADSFYVEIIPKATPNQKTWVLMLPAVDFDPAAAGEMTPEQEKKMQEGLVKAVALGNLSGSPQATTMFRMGKICEQYGVNPTHLYQAVPSEHNPNPSRVALGKDMVKLYNTTSFVDPMTKATRKMPIGQLLESFLRDVVNSALPTSTNQDGTVATPEQKKANELRNQVGTEYLRAAAISELLLNALIPDRSRNSDLNNTAPNSGLTYNSPKVAASMIESNISKVGNGRPATRGPRYLVEGAQSADAMKAGLKLDSGIMGKLLDVATPEIGLPSSSDLKFTCDNEVSFLPDGEKAWNQRIADIDSAIALVKSGKQVRYDFTVWKFYGADAKDSHKLSQTLMAKIQEAGQKGVEVHITVDKGVASRDAASLQILGALDPQGFVMAFPALALRNSALAPLLSAPVATDRKIQVHYFNNNGVGRPGDSNHSKSAIISTIDASGVAHPISAIVGGRNISPDYFFWWRDAEFYMKSGSVVTQLKAAEQEAWNQQNLMNVLINADQNDLQPIVGCDFSKAQTKVVALATHEMPGPTANYNGLSGVIAGLEIAGDRFTMVQAYVLQAIPKETVDPLLNALERALARGVNVDIITNSPETVDEPMISGRIVEYTAGLLSKLNTNTGDMGRGILTIYMKNKFDGIGGATLHAKANYDEYAFVSESSNNLHANGFLQQEGQRYYFNRGLQQSVKSWGDKLKTVGNSTPYTNGSTLANFYKGKTESKGKQVSSGSLSASASLIDGMLELILYQL